MRKKQKKLTASSLSDCYKVLKLETPSVNGTYMSLYKNIHCSQTTFKSIHVGRALYTSLYTRCY